MTKTRVGLPHYINTYPLIFPLEKNLLFHDIEFVFDEPRVINKAMKEGALDAALVSSVHFMNHLDEYELVSTLGIGATKKAMSVCLFIKEPLHAVEKPKIGITTASETSKSLLAILLREVWKIEYETVQIDETLPHEELEKLDGFLMIGDRALQLHDLPGYKRIDLATEWYQVTSLPFVFAVFAAKKGANLKWLHFALRFALEWSINHRAEIVDAAHEKLNIPKQRLQRYFATLDYELTKEHMEGLKHFYSFHQKYAVHPAKT